MGKHDGSRETPGGWVLATVTMNYVEFMVWVDPNTGHLKLTITPDESKTKVFGGDWEANPGMAYTTGQVVKYQGSFYECVHDEPGEDPPPGNANWQAFTPAEAWYYGVVEYLAEVPDQAGDYEDEGNCV